MADYDRAATDRPAIYGEGLDGSGIFDREESGSAPTENPVATDSSRESVYQEANFLPPQVAYTGDYSTWVEFQSNELKITERIGVKDGVSNSNLRFNKPISVTTGAQLYPRLTTCTFRADVFTVAVQEQYGGHSVIPFVKLKMNGASDTYIHGEAVEVPLADYNEETETVDFNVVTAYIQFQLPEDTENSYIERIQFGFSIDVPVDEFDDGDDTIDNDHEAFFVGRTSVHQGTSTEFKHPILIPATFQNATFDLNSRRITAEQITLTSESNPGDDSAVTRSWVEAAIAAAIADL